jgi:hypothetical protein
MLSTIEDFFQDFNWHHDETDLRKDSLIIPHFYHKIISYEKRACAQIDDREAFKPLFFFVPKLCRFKQNDSRIFYLCIHNGPSLPDSTYLGASHKFNETL